MAGVKATLPFAMALALLTGGGSVLAQAQQTSDDGTDMTTDRPGFNAPAAVVGTGVVQLELGWSTARLRDRTYASTLPQPLLRVGVSEHVELKVASDGLAAACVLDCAWHGADVSVGGRVVLPVAPFGFAIAATGGVSLPTGNVEVSSSHVDPLGAVHVDHAIAAAFELSYNYLITRIRDDDADRAFVRHGHGLSFGATAGRWTPYVGMAWRPEHVGGRTPCLAQAGTGVRVGRDVQLDITLDHGVNTVEPSWGISAGVSVRHRPR
jgi:hypothetical protein